MFKLTIRSLPLAAILAVFIVLIAVMTATAQLAPPPNDSFNNAQDIKNVSGFLQGTNIDASIEPDEPPSCSNCATVWYRWTAPADLSMTFETVMYTVTPDNYLNDTVIGVYMGGNLAKLQTLTWNDNVSIKRNNMRSRVTFVAVAGQTYNIRVFGNAESQGLFLLQWDINGAESWKQYSFDGCNFFAQRKSDFAVFRPNDNVWWISLDDPIYMAVGWGLSGDVLVPGDYFGDGCTDLAVWRPDGTWWIYDPIFRETLITQWGMAGDVPIRGDFDGDDTADLAVYRRGNPSTFWIQNSGDGSVSVIEFGYQTDTPVCADYDGDGRTDLAVKYHPYGPSFFIIRRSSDLSRVMIAIGLYNDYVVPGDFDRDGKNDVAVFGNEWSGFRLIRSSDGQGMAYDFGVAGDIPVAGDYMGNTGSDLCVWRPSAGTFYCFDPLSQQTSEFRWGMNGDKPISAITAF